MSLRCPNCSTEMMLSNKNGVEIDHCPRCRGVWLDRGELEKITSMQNRYDDDHHCFICSCSQFVWFNNNK